MLKFVLASCLAAASLAQFVEPEKAKILKEQRFNAGDGRFGAAYAQEDGFRILEGDHVPTGANGQTAAQFQATPAPRQQFAHQQQQFVQPRESTAYDYEYYDGAVPE